jgi:hypothetical protein
MDLIKRAGTAALGVAVTLGWWTLRGSEPDNTKRITSVPDVVWEGGTSVTIEVSSNQPGKLHLSFGRQGSERDAHEEMIEANVALDAGDHRYDINIPSGVHGYVELGFDSPPLGSKASVRVRIGDRVVAEDSGELDRPLEPNTAFFAQVHMQDYAAGAVD